MVLHLVNRFLLFLSFPFFCVKPGELGGNSTPLKNFIYHFNHTTRSGGWLGSYIDEERSKMRNVMWIAELVNHRIFERKSHSRFNPRVYLCECPFIGKISQQFCGFSGMASKTVFSTEIAADGCVLAVFSPPGIKNLWDHLKFLS